MPRRGAGALTYYCCPVTKLGIDETGTEMRHRVIHAVVVAILVALVRTGYADSASADAVEPAPRLDLAAIVVVPSDVGQPGFGRLGGATETIDDQVRHLVGSDDVNAGVARETLRNAGFRRRYASALALPIHPAAARVDFALRIDAYAIEFTDATGAKTGFEFLRTWPVAPDASQIPGIAPIGDLWEATSGTLVREDGRTHLIQDLRFQDGNVVVGVTVTSDADGGAPPDISMLVSLAETMEQRLASIRKENEPGLGALVVRLDDENADPGIDDAYLRANGETFPAYNQPQDDLAELTERFGPAQTVYALDQAIGIPETDPAGPPYFGLWLLRFPSPAAASAWLAAVDRGDPERGYLHRRSVPDAVTYGDESLTFSYRFAASNSLTTRGYQIYARVGAEIARVQIDALPEDPLAAVEELAEAQVGQRVGQDAPGLLGGRRVIS